MKQIGDLVHWLRFRGLSDALPGKRVIERLDLYLRSMVPAILAEAGGADVALRPSRSSNGSRDLRRA